MLKLISLIMMGLFLTACGGGGSGSPNGDPQPGNPQSVNLSKEVIATMDISYSAGEVAQYTKRTVDNSGNVLHQLRYTGSGPDTNWFTDDDEIQFSKVYEYNASGQLIKTINQSIGLDEIPLTDDDSVIDYATVSYMENGLKSRMIRILGSGNDGVWFTDDDIEDVDSYIDETWTEQGQQKSFILYYPGADSIWFTNDDLNTGSYYQHEYNEFGLATRTHFYYGFGADKKPFTSDDLISTYSEKIYNDKGIVIKYLLYSSPGADNIKFTNDDVLNREISVSKYDANGHPSQRISGSRGPDGVWGTLDDTILIYMNETYDVDGYLISSSTYSDPGADMEWFTNDDVKISYREFTRK